MNEQAEPAEETPAIDAQAPTMPTLPTVGHDWYAIDAQAATETEDDAKDDARRRADLTARYQRLFMGAKQ